MYSLSIQCVYVGSDHNVKRSRKKLATSAPTISSMFSVLTMPVYTITYNISVSGEKPTLPELLDLKVPANVSDKYEEFGIVLLKDEDGKKMAVIKNDCRGEAKKITLQILKEWMEGDGMSVTWESLITALRKCGPLLADQIEIALKKH